MALYSKDLHVFKYPVEFQTNQIVDLPNGLTDDVPVTIFKRHGAIHNATGKYLETLDGFNRTTDIVIAIKSVRNDPIQFDMDTTPYTIKFRGKEYKIRQLDANDGNDLVGFHLIFLRRKTSAN